LTRKRDRDRRDKREILSDNQKSPPFPPQGNVGVPHGDLLAGSLHADRQPLQLASTMTRRLLLISPTRIVEILETSKGKQDLEIPVMASWLE
jgi:hypothetical protein